MEVSTERLQSAMRFSFSHLLKQEEIVEAARRVCEVVKRVRGGA
jgi:cysteine sulfinate desulfinase/cysteine desulfurase-like protein